MSAIRRIKCKEKPRLNLQRYSDVQSLFCQMWIYPHASQAGREKKRADRLESTHPVGSQHRGEATCVSNARCTRQGTRECEVEAKCVILYFMHETRQACLQPYKNTHKPISASWFVFSLYFLGAENSLLTNCIRILLM